jgi:hypothetical protein
MKALSRESRLLLDAARDGDEPSVADRKRVRSALAKKLAVGVAASAVAATATHAAAGGVTAAGTSGAAASTAAAGAGIGAGVAGGAGAGSVAAGAIGASFGAKLLLSAVLVGAMGAGTVGYVRHEEARRDAVAAAREALPAARSGGVGASLGAAASGPRVPVATVSVPPVNAAPAVAPVAGGSDKLGAPSKPVALPLAAPAAPVSPTLAVANAPVASATSSSDLDAELALLQDVHGALRANEGARALRLLDEHRRRFPNGALAEESEAARVFALCQVGRADEARDVAGRFLREHARSPLAPRVARACDAEGSTF